MEVLGKLDLNKLFAVTTQERMLKRLVYEYEKMLRERLPACEWASGKTVETSCTILDLNGVGLSSFYKVKSYVGEASTIGQNYCGSHYVFPVRRMRSRSTDNARVPPLAQTLRPWVGSSLCVNLHSLSLSLLQKEKLTHCIADQLPLGLLHRLVPHQALA